MRPFSDRQVEVLSSVNEIVAIHGTERHEIMMNGG
jgi:hypothetical protein